MDTKIGCCTVVLPELYGADLCNSTNIHLKNVNCLLIKGGGAATLECVFEAGIENFEDAFDYDLYGSMLMILDEHFMTEKEFNFIRRYFSEKGINVSVQKDFFYANEIEEVFEFYDSEDVLLIKPYWNSSDVFMSDLHCVVFNPSRDEN